MNVTFRRFIPLVVGLCLAWASPRLFAQSNYSARTATSMLSIGAAFEGGISRSFNLRDGETGGSVFSYRGGVAARYPFSASIAGMLSLGIDSRGLEYDITDTIHVFNNPGTIESHTTDRITYFSVTPGIQFSIFYLGLNVGLPLSGNRTAQGTTHIPNLNVDTTATSIASFDTLHEQLNIMIEPRIGMLIPVLDNQTGWLGVSAVVGYPLNRVTKPVDVNGQTFEDPHQLATIELGVTWQFAIPGTGGN